MKTLLTAVLIFLSVGAQALEVGDAAPCVGLNHIGADNTESEHCIRDRKEGQQYTIIEFFLTTCSDCKENLPKLRELGASVANQAATRMVGIDRRESDVRAYVQKYRMDLPFEIGFDSERNAKKAYGVVATPTTFVLNSENQIVYKHVGVLSQSNLSQIRALIQGQ